jgi:hypothetical protein
VSSLSTKAEKREFVTRMKGLLKQHPFMSMGVILCAVLSPSIPLLPLPGANLKAIPFSCFFFSFSSLALLYFLRPAIMNMLDETD